MSDAVNKASANSTKRQPTALRTAWQVIRVLLVAYLLIVLLMMLLENSFIFFPTKYPAGNWNPAALAFEDAWFQAADGTRLHGWYVPHDRPRAVVLFAHGNAGNISHRDDLLRELHRMGVTVLAFDYRGYGRSDGSPNEQGVLADGRAARKWLAQRARVPEQEIVLMGESLGAAVATVSASELPARGLVLENVFSSVPDTAAVHYPWLPTSLLRTGLDAASAIQKHHGPLLQVHAEADTIIPLHLGRKVFDAANEPKRFVTMHGADHNDPRSPEFYQAFNQFLNELPSTANTGDR